MTIMECRDCGFYTDCVDLINECDTTENGDFICPSCGAIAIVTENNDCHSKKSNDK